jgi:gamma-glutamyl-gamma-aminobutyrate hydrolase PuuD
VVAVTARHLKPGRVSSWSTGAVALPRGYCDALERAGAIPVLLPPVSLEPSDAATMLAGMDGLVLAGGADVDPSLYGQEPHPSVYGSNISLDRFEMALAESALERDAPILAICRGHQLLNVLLGGTLDQHITDRPGVEPHGDPGSGPGGGIDHAVTIESSTQLAEALGTVRCTVRSHHHQAVADLAPKAVATAWSDDGVLEGYELQEGWVVSVQWHPETTAADDPVQQRLFDSLVAHI